MACLDWLVPDHPPPGTQTLLPPLHSRRSILSPEKEKKHTYNKRSCIHVMHSNNIKQLKHLSIRSKQVLISEHKPIL
jgi:hypothetical protein